ncbi:MAG TPA: restriction endonuclease subunit S [Hanamia sp.]|nr:restriction endonuclease subunit S [Hanamia sp.]
MKSNYKKIGEHIRLVDKRNPGLKVKQLLGLSISKQFIPSVANIIGTDMENYKIIRKNQFACSTMQVRRDKKMPIALLNEVDEAIISAAYPVFEVTDTEKLLPEYLMMWFSRQEFDREACFYAIGGVRGSLEWEDFCEMKFPIPHPDKQKEIVKEYNTIVNRIELNNQIIQKLEETAQAIYKQWFVDFEFPDPDGKAYKSNGGKMEFNEELEKEIPKGWRSGCLGDLIELQRGFDLATQHRKIGEFPIYASTGIAEYHADYKVKGPGIVTGRSGSLGEVFYVEGNFWPLNTTLWIKNFKNATPIFAFYVLKGINIIDYNSGSAVPTLNRNHIHLHQLEVPEISVIENFEKIEKKIFHQLKIVTEELKLLKSFQDVLLSKLATIEN